MYKPELAYRSDGPERGTRNEGLYMRSSGKEKTPGPFRRFVRPFQGFFNIIDSRANDFKFGRI